MIHSSDPRHRKFVPLVAPATFGCALGNGSAFCTCSVWCLSLSNVSRWHKMWMTHCPQETKTCFAPLNHQYFFHCGMRCCSYRGKTDRSWPWRVAEEHPSKRLRVCPFVMGDVKYSCKCFSNAWQSCKTISVQMTLGICSGPFGPSPHQLPISSLWL